MKSFDRFDPENLELYKDMAYKVIIADSAFDLCLYGLHRTKRCIWPRAGQKIHFLYIFSYKYANLKLSKTLSLPACILIMFYEKEDIYEHF